MSRLFDLESPLMRFLNRVADLMILNIVTLLGCIPIITAGASLTGMHYVLLKMARGEEAYIVKDWWKSFKLNFKQATLIWLMTMVIGVLIVLDYIIYLRGGMDFPMPMKVLTGVAAIIVFIVYLYVFPVLSHFDNNIRNTVRNALFMSILGFPRTIAMVIISIVPIAIVILMPAMIFRLLPIYILFVFTVPGYACALLYSSLFKRFEPEKEKPKPSDELTDDEYKEVADILKSDDVVEVSDKDRAEN